MSRTRTSVAALLAVIALAVVASQMIRAQSPPASSQIPRLADGKPNREIGKILHISTRTVDTHRSNILKKLNLKTNAELVRLAIGEGLISV